MESVAVFTQKPDDFTPPRCCRKANTEDKGNPADRGDTENRAPGYCDAICCNIITIIICTDCSRIQPAYCIGEKFCSKLLMLQNIYIDMSILDSNYGSRWPESFRFSAARRSYNDGRKCLRLEHEGFLVPLVGWRERFASSATVPSDTASSLATEQGT